MDLQGRETIGHKIASVTEPLVTFDNVGVEAGGRWLLRDISLSIGSSGLTFILGPNGAGKTLLLRIAHGLIAPTVGTVDWNGQPLQVARRRQAMVFQMPTLLRRTVLANVEYPLKTKGLKGAERRARALEALGWAELGPLAKQPARSLSGGEQQRLAVARAWAVGPDILLLDEPTANLDPTSTKRIEDLISLVQQDGTKIVMTSHDLGQARRLGNDILFLNRGRLVERGLASEFFTTPQTDAAKRFLQGELVPLRRKSAFLVLVCLCALVGWGAGKGERVKLGATTTFENSGLASHLLPMIEKATGVRVTLVINGTGQTLKLAERGDLDAILVHAKLREKAFVKAGLAIERSEIMWNEFVIVGPANDPAKISGLKSAAEALVRIEKAQSVFISRGDDSGTHLREMELWRSAKRDPKKFTPTWYRSSGSGMGTTLNIAVGAGGYALTDRATWLAFGNRAKHRILFEGDRRLINAYGFLLLNLNRHPHIKYEKARRLRDWLISPAGQKAITDFKIKGKQAYFRVATGYRTTVGHEPCCESHGDQQHDSLPPFQGVVVDEDHEQSSRRDQQRTFPAHDSYMPVDRGDGGPQTQGKSEVGDVGTDHVADRQIDGVALRRSYATHDHLGKRCAQPDNQRAHNYWGDLEMFGQAFSRGDGEIRTDREQGDATNERENCEHYWGWTLLVYLLAFPFWSGRVVFVSRGLSGFDVVGHRAQLWRDRLAFFDDTEKFR